MLEGEEISNKHSHTSETASSASPSGLTMGEERRMSLSSLGPTGASNLKQDEQAVGSVS